MIRKVNLTTNVVSTLAGALYYDGAGTSSTFKQPQNLAMDAAGTFALVVSPR